GHGLQLIVKELVKDNTPTWSDCDKWYPQYIRRILRDRTAIGEYQPRRGRKPEGEPIPGYYPVVVDESTWLRAQAAMTARQKRSGRPGRGVASLFTGLVYDARTRERMTVAGNHTAAGGRRLTPCGFQRDAARVGIPYAVFEEAILSRLVEIDPVEILDA